MRQSHYDFSKYQHMETRVYEGKGEGGLSSVVEMVHRMPDGRYVLSRMLHDRGAASVVEITEKGFQEWQTKSTPSQEALFAQSQIAMMTDAGLDMPVHTLHPIQQQMYHEGDAGYDLQYYGTTSAYLEPHSRQALRTGVRVAIPYGCVGFAKSRSGNAFKHGLEVGAGVIDASYRGEMNVLLYNHSNMRIEIRPGDRIAQLVVLRLGNVNITHVDDINQLGTTTRGTDGFGSTGGIAGQ